MSVSSAGTQLDYSATDIALDAVGWTNLLCILDLDRDGPELEIDVQDGCLNSATSSPTVAKHKTTKSVDQGTVTGTAMFDGDKYAFARGLVEAGTKTYFRVIDPDNRNSSGVLQIADCSGEKIHGWLTKVGKAHPAGGGRMTATFTITVDTGVYTPTP